MNNCDKCNANCCSKLPGNLYIDQKDIELFKKNNILISVETIFDCEGVFVGILGYKDKQCKYFTQHKGIGRSCMVYESRPRACREFQPSFCGRFQEVIIKEEV